MNKYSITFVPREGGHVWVCGDYIVGYHNAVRVARQYCEDLYKKTGVRLDYYLDKLIF